MEDIFNGSVDYIALYLGIDGPTLFATLAMLSIVFRFVGKRIPDDAKGLLGILRDVSKVLGLYVSNRVVSNVTVADVAKSIIYDPRADDRK